jgi:hypothetical protein
MKKDKMKEKWNKVFNGISKEDAESCEGVGSSCLSFHISEEKAFRYFDKMALKYGVIE